MKCRVSVWSAKNCVCLVLFLAVAGCTQEQTEPKGLLLSIGNAVTAKTTLLATISDDEKPHQPPFFMVVFNDKGRGVAYVAQKEGRLYIVHNGKAGRPVTSMDQMVISPDGRRIAYSAQIDSKWRMVIDDGVGVASDEVGESVFSPDSRNIAYEAREGKKWYVVVNSTLNAIAGSANITPTFSADSKKIAYVEKAGDKDESRLIVRDLAFKEQSIKESSGSQLLTSRDRIRLAAVKKSGKQQKVIEFSFDQPDSVKDGPLYDTISSLTFGADGASVAYVAERGGKRFLVLNGKEERLPDGSLAGPPVVRPANKAVGVILSNAKGFFLHQAFLDDESKKKAYEEAADLVYSDDGSLHAYTARKGVSWFIVVNGNEGPAFDRVVSPVFSSDSKKLVYRARKDGKRFVVVADAEGKTIRQHPSYEQVFPVVFTADGKSVAYGVKDGLKLVWMVEKL